MEKCYEKLIYQKITFKNGYTGGASFCIVILFAACKNFLNAKETKSQIDAAIAYANSSEYTIYIKYSGKNGVVKSPAGSEISKKVTDTFTLSFDPIGDYEFVSWKITNDTTNEELPNGEYLKIEDILNSETKCTFVKAPESDMKLCLSPVVTERPQILSYAPMLSTEMSFKDSAIQVVFDYPMDPDSIYYTQAEFDELMAQLNLTDKNDPALLRTTITKDEAEQTKYYGYIKDGITYYKNITITASETGESLTGFFEAPTFVVENKLVINVKDFNSLPDYGEIQVELDKDFFYTLNGKPITMAGNKKWIYQIKDTRDNKGPEIIKQSAKIVLPAGTEDLGTDTYSDATLKRSTIKAMKSKISTSSETTFNFNVRVRDEGNGVKPYFYVYYQKIYDENYEKTNNKNVGYFKIPFQSVTTYDASFNGNFSKGLDSGIYKLVFGFEDSVGNITCYPDVGWKPDDPENPRNATDWNISSYNAYVFTVDWTCPDNYGNFYFYKYSQDNGSSYSYKLYWKIDFPSQAYKGYNDLSSITIRDKSTGYRLDLPREFGDLVDPSEGLYVFYFTVQSDTDVCIQFEDCVGNKSVIKEVRIPAANKIGQDNTFIAGRKIYSTQYSPLIVSDHEVTQKEYEQYMTWHGEQQQDSDLKPSDSKGKGDNYPAYYVNWYEAIMYCNLRSIAEGLTPVYYLGDDVNNYNIAQWGVSEIASISRNDKNYYYYNATDANETLDNVKENPAANGWRLPKSNERRYFAQRADLDDYTYVGTNSYSEIAAYAWYNDNSGSKTHEVKTTTKNNGTGCELYDIMGNVGEWGFNKDSSNNRLLNGGNYLSTVNSGELQIFYLNYSSPTIRRPTIGFRVVRTYIPQ